MSVHKFRNLAMIPARMDSQRLRQKNLRELGGVPLISHAIRKCLQAGVFDQIWVNSEHRAFEEIALREGVHFHHRPEALAGHAATSEQFVYEFLNAHPCDFLFQVHTIAPLLTAAQVAEFVEAMAANECDVLLSVVDEQIECVYQGFPINFRFEAKTNSQELAPVRRITWSITGWRPPVFMAAYEAGGCATYAGRIDYFPIDRQAGIIIKTEEDLRLADALFRIRETS